MRVLMLQNGMPPYWIARMRAIRQQSDAEITLITNSGGERGRPDEDVDDLGVNWIKLTNKALEDISFGPLVPKTIALIRQLMPDVAYLAGTVHANFMAAHAYCQMLGIPIVGSNISTDYDHRPGGRLIRYVKETIKRGVLSMVDVMMVPGERAFEHMRGFGMPEDRLLKAGHAAATVDYHARSQALSKPELEAKLAEMGLPPSGYLLFVGRLSWVKNLPRLIEAYSKARAQIGESMPKLVLIGDGDDRAEIVAQIAKAGLEKEVLLPGYFSSDQLLYAFSGARLFLLPSLTETWGMVVNEAMACGTPCVVSTHCGCVPDLIEDGVTGYAVPPESVDEIADAIVKSLADTRSDAAISEALWQKVSQHSPARFAETFHRACRLALYRHGRRSSP